MVDLSPKEVQECGYLSDIVTCIQERVDLLASKLYKNDPCKPVFTVGVLWRSGDTQEITLNCTHLGKTYSRVLFPREECFYGYESLGEAIKAVYNQTM